MHYVYGRIRLAVKSVLKEQFTEEEMLKFKGCFEPYLYIPKNNRILESLIDHEKINFKYIDMFIKKLIISCIIVNWNLRHYGHYCLEPIDAMKILEDINVILFNKVDSYYGNGSNDSQLVHLKSYCDLWRQKFLTRYIYTYNFLKRHWDTSMCKPDDVITSMFKDGYFYKERAKRHEKSGSKRTDWSWLEGKNTEEIARYLIENDIHNDGKLKEAFKKRHISIRDVKKEITRLNVENREFIDNCMLQHWFKSFNDEQKESIITMYNHAKNGTMDKEIFALTLVKAYHLNERLLQQFDALALMERLID
jgi:hypothetical protein